MSSSGTEIRITKNRGAWRTAAWTSIPNALLLDSTIEWDAKGAFGWLSMAADDPDFEVTAKSLGAAGPRGRDHAQRMVRQLEEHGWLTRHRVAAAGGQPVLEYELHPAPVPLEQRTFRPSTARPRRRTLSQVKPEKLDGQAFDSGPEELDGQALGADQAKRAPKKSAGVSAGQARKTGRPGPGRSGVPTTSLERDACMHEALWAELRAAGIEVDAGGRRAVGPQVDVAMSTGWTTAGLVTWVRRQLTGADHLFNPGGFVVSVLRDLPPRPPELSVVPAPVDMLPPACPSCLAANPASRSNLRWRQGADGTPCPACHPEVIKNAGGNGAETAGDDRTPVSAGEKERESA